MQSVSDGLEEESKVAAGILQLVRNVARLRSPAEGCVWFRQQTFQALRKYLLEEVYEVLDPLDSDIPDQLQEELGDLLFQIIGLCQLASERGWFSLGNVLDVLNQKVMHRNPHVFGEVQANTVEEVQRIWQERKSQERNACSSTMALAAVEAVTGECVELKRMASYSSTGAQIDVQAGQVELRFPNQQVISFSTEIPDIRCAGYFPTYTSKGWLWCAYNNALDVGRIQLSEDRKLELFQEVWSKCMLRFRRCIES